MFCVLKRWSLPFSWIICSPVCFWSFLSLVALCVCVLSHVWLFMTWWTVTLQAPLSMEFSGQEHWSRLPPPPPGDLPRPGMKHVSPVSLALTCGFFTTHPLGKPSYWLCLFLIILDTSQESLSSTSEVLDFLAIMPANIWQPFSLLSGSNS